MVTRRPTRPGFALLDAIIGGALLALGLASIVTLSQRSLAMLQRGEREALAAAMLDELLSQVVTEGPGAFSRVRQPSGLMPEPWPNWEYSVQIDAGGEGDAYDVLATVRDPTGAEYRCATRVAPHDDQSLPPDRAPLTPIDRAAEREKRRGTGNG